MTKQEILNAIEEFKFTRMSAWKRGVKKYAYDMIDELTGEQIQQEVALCENRKLLHKLLLNGASDWLQYSWGGCSLIYNRDIAECLCSPSELKRTNGGTWRPNAREEWLDVQARALRQAEVLIASIIFKK